MTREEIIALAERCEKATGPDRELDAQIWVAVTPACTRRELRGIHKATGKEQIIDETREPDGRLIIVPAVTASLDAAMTLVPEGWGYSICPTSALLTRSTSDHGVMARAATPALALTAAALRAKAASL
jgi:hypothetical protein